MEVRSVEAIFGALNAAEVRYLVVGGLAVVAHGYERLTDDVDLVIQLESQNILRGLRALFGIGYSMRIPASAEEFADPEVRERWRSEKQMIVLQLWSDVHRRTPIDVFVYEPFAFDEEYTTARHETVIGAIRAPIVSYDTLVAMKKSAGRLQDLADLADLAVVQKLKESRD